MVSDILDSGHLPTVSHILDHVKIRNLSELIEEFTDLELYQNLASALISPKIEADKVARDFTASTASAYRLSTSEVTFPNINSDLPGLNRLLKHKQKLRKL
jgi:hypothetical protein